MPTIAIRGGATTYAMRFIALALASYAGAIVGFTLLPSGTGAALVWPCAAIGIAALFLYGYDLWPALFISTGVVLYTHNTNVPFDIIIALADTLEALIGAYILKRYIRFNPLIHTLRDGFGLIVACAVSALVPSIIITLTSYYFGRIGFTDIEPLFTSILTGHVVTSLSLAPFLLRWLYRPIFTKTPLEILEGLVIFGSISVLSYFLFWTNFTSLGELSLLYILIFPLFWAVMRSGPRGATLALFITSTLGITGIFYGHGPLAASHSEKQVFVVQILIGVLDLIFILFTAIIEERKNITLSLAASVSQLEAAVKKISSEDSAKANFLAILAHELRNPLAPIVSSVELLKLEKSTEHYPELVETIGLHARTMSVLLEDLLDITRITHNKFELRREYITLQRALTRSAQSAQTTIATRKHELRVDMPEQPLNLYADPVRLEQIFVNLLNNAAKYTNDGGIITLTAREAGRFAVITITDNGIGISESKLGMIFELYGQIREPSRKSGGLGVGLSLTKRLVELHGGTIEVYSAGVGKGSTFTVRLPLATTPNPIPAGTQSSTNISRGASAALRMLVVDDNRPATKGLGRLLEHAGHTVRLAYDGASAIVISQEFRPEVVVLDIGLPDINGYEVAAQIRKALQSPVRIVALTGYGQEDDRQKSAEAGFDAHLIKLVSIADLERVLR